MTEHAVVIAGGGPTGLMLAAELTLAGTDVVVVERRATPDIESSRAGGLHARTLEILDQRGVAGRFLEAGTAMQVQFFSMIPLDISDVPTRHPYGLALWQRHIERLLAGWADELGVAVLRGCEVTGLAQDDDGVDVALSGGRALRARYLVGCDGGRSLVRRTAGIGFPGWDASTSYLIAELRTREAPELGLRPTEKGTNGIGPLDDGERYRVVVCEGEARTGDPTLDDLSAAMTDVWGTDFGPHDPTWISRFTDMTRQAESYRAGRVLLAGDAAHVHSPNGGQGLNIGVQDAVNLGWKLARVVAGTAPPELLDTYHAERHPVGARVLRLTMAMTGLSRGDARTLALRDTVTDLLSRDEPRRRYGATIAGLDVHYDLGEGHPLLGRRMPDLDLDTAEGPRTVAGLLHEARPLLLELDGGVLDGAAPWDGRVRRIAATYEGAWELPALGPVDAPSAVLIRPDGYVAWVGEGADAGLTEALATWFGPA